MAITNLSLLLKNANPQHIPGTYVFVSLQNPSLYLIDKSTMTFKEKEGTTLIVSKEIAKQENIPFKSEFSWIMMEINSDLEAVGFTAAFSTELTKHGISCNVVAGYFHDHLFVPFAKVDEALQVLSNLG